MITSSCPQVAVTVEDRVARIALGRPERRNALTLDMYAALAEVIDAANREPDVRVLVLEGSDGCFTSGNDLKDFMSEPVIHEHHPTVRFMSALRHCPKPVVAIVEGHAVGIGTTLLLHCDLVFVAEDATLQLPFVNLGLCPEYGSSYLLPRMLGHHKAAELLLLGETFSGNDAAAMGLANAAAPAWALREIAETKIAKLANQPPAAVRHSKSLLKQSQHTGVDAALAAEFKHFALGLQSDEFKEAIAAFFEKRSPDFSRFT